MRRGCGWRRAGARAVSCALAAASLTACALAAPASAEAARATAAAASDRQGGTGNSAWDLDSAVRLLLHLVHAVVVEPGKARLPLLGRYSSDDTGIMRQHVRWAKSAGIDGFLVSWKSTPVLDDRLARLIRVANAQHFRLGIVYEGLDFHRRPLPIATVRHDLERFAATFAHNRAFAIFDRPLVIWSGTWRYTNAQIRFATQSVRGRLLLLASAKNTRDYERVAPLVDGDAYYWSSVNPRRISTTGQARADGPAIRRRESGSPPSPPGSTLAASAARARAARTATRCAPSSPRLCGVAGHDRPDQLERVQRELLRRTIQELRIPVA